MANLDALANDLRSGKVTLEQLESQYKLSTLDIKKIEEINAKIEYELGVKDDPQPLPGSTELALDDGTKILAAKIKTVNQPKGGFVNVFMAQDGKEYYQYTDANGNQQKVTKAWDYLGATIDNIQVAWNKMQDGHPLDALMTLMEGAEDPRSIITGVAPGVGLAGKGGGFLKSMKDFGSWLKKLKNVKTFEQFKSFAMSFIQKMKPTKQMKPSKKLPDGLDVNMYNALDKRNVVAQAYRFGNAAERHQGIINSENTTKIIANLSKTLGKNINPKDLKVVSLANGNRYEFHISYFDSASGKAYCFMSDGTPNLIMNFKYGITGKITDYNITAGWLNGKWADF